MMSTAIKDITSLAVFDTETTGLSVEDDRIVTAYIGVMLPDGSIYKSKSWLVNPGITIPQAAYEVHGISTEVAAQFGTDAATAIADIRRLLADLQAAGVPVVAYNAKYDLTLLDRECRRYGVEPLPIGDLRVIDPLVIDRAVDKFRKGRRTLEVTCIHYGVSLEGAHDAEADAVATGRLAYKVLRLLNPDATMDDIHRTQVVRAAEQAAALQEHLRVRDPHAFVEPQWPVAVFGS